MVERIYPVGIQTFSDIIKRGCVYVDKTDLIYKLTKKYKYVFLSRPRRFGKSLLSTTLHSYFAGEKDLFKGLAIEGLEKDWTEYPVLHFDMSTFKNCNLKDLQSKFNYKLSEYESIWGNNPESETPGDRFKNLIISAKEQTGKPVIIIIDEYDAPLLDVLHNEDRLAEIRTIIQEFYAPIKANDEYIRFAFITGITKFSQLSIFSAINNLANISMDPEFAAICGITKEELTTTLNQDIELMAEHNGVSKEEMARMLQENYDGYHFTRNSPDIFNPFSLMRALASGEIEDYWFASGTSTYLINQMQRFKTDVTELDNVFAFSSSFDRPTEKMSDALPLLYQSGYLTIKGYDPLSKGYYLGIPNKEVRAGLTKKATWFLSRLTTENS
ncbi:AAA family ATPase [Prevotella hominis]|uniref:ATP-binding protein n=1 Tax=Segatella hominis TaxID=2518605 RepID=UPI001F190570|nr:AAA family ATPase [Segatella hominis]MCF2590652.1 AAA family ATPase [Segatella hominis]